VKTLDLEVLRDDGYLQEVNRLFFHPLGLALAVALPTKAGEPPPSLSVLDAREDLEGFHFIENDLNVKFLRLHNISRLRRVARVNKLGYWVQPLGEIK
jgi:hypothetical protein